MAWIDPIAPLVSEWCMKCPQYVDQASSKLNPNTSSDSLTTPNLITFIYNSQHLLIHSTHLHSLDS